MIEAVDNSARRKKIAELKAQRSPSCSASSTLTPENFYSIAGDGLRMMLDARRDQGLPLRQRDIIEAASALLPMLDIHPSVWFEGLSTLGDHGFPPVDPADCQALARGGNPAAGGQPLLHSGGCGPV